MLAQQLWKFGVFRSVAPASPHGLRTQRRVKEGLPTPHLLSHRTQHSAVTHRRAIPNCRMEHLHAHLTPWSPSGAVNHHLHRDSLGNVYDELHVGIVVVIGPPWDRNVLICHLDVFCSEAGESGKNQREARAGEMQHILPSGTALRTVW